VTDNVGTDGVDLLRNFEVLRFSDQDVAIATNRQATGAPIISDTSPTEGFALNVNTAGIADPDGLGAFSFQWQTSADGGATWTNIANATTAAFIPVQDQVNTQLRVAVRFTDGQGLAEEVFSTATDVVGDMIVTGAGNDTINGTAGADDINGDAGDDSINGLAGNDTLLGGAGADNINGGTGVDSMVGGSGNDTYTEDDVGDILVEAANDGTDTVQSSLTYTLAANLENLTLTGRADINGTGNAANNVITGNSDDNVLSGLAGNDSLNGGNRNDTLNGGAGSDILTGGAGTDSFQFVLAESLLTTTNTTSFSGDTITDFAFGTDAVDGPTAVTAANMTSRTLAALATYTDATVAAALSTNLTAAGVNAWAANRSARVTFGAGATAQTFMVLGNAAAGYQAGGDAVIKFQFTGTLTNFAIV
jgi:Ca2+-binding RTX toxin-like protein